MKMSVIKPELYQKAMEKKNQMKNFSRWYEQNNETTTKLGFLLIYKIIMANNMNRIEMFKTL